MTDCQLGQPLLQLLHVPHHRRIITGNVTLSVLSMPQSPTASASAYDHQLRAQSLTREVYSERRGRRQLRHGNYLGTYYLLSLLLLLLPASTPR